MAIRDGKEKRADAKVLGWTWTGAFQSRVLLLGATGRDGVTRTGCLVGRPLSLPAAPMSAFLARGWHIYSQL